MSAQRSLSLISTVRALTAGTFHKMPSNEREYHRELCDLAGEVGGEHFARIPTSMLGRDLTAASAGGGGYLVETKNVGYVESLRRLSIGLSLGVRTETLELPAGNVVIPTGTTDPGATWLANETSSGTESNPGFGQVAASPKTLCLYVEISRQLLLQSDADRILKYRFAVAAKKALDEALLGGSGAAGQPTGIVTTSGVGAFTGASLDYAAIIDAQKDVADGEGVEDVNALGWAATPSVAALLMARHKVASTASPLWEGNLSSGRVCGAPAYASKSLPSASAVYGDWSAASIIEWGAAVITANPFANFAAGLVGLRLLLSVDIVITRPKAFSVGTSIT